MQSLFYLKQRVFLFATSAFPFYFAKVAKSAQLQKDLLLMNDFFFTLSFQFTK